MNKKLSGVFAPITTPFNDKFEVSYNNLRKNMKFYTSSKLSGYLALGSNGENKSLTIEEKEKVLDIILSNKNSEQLVLTGCIAESTKETIDLAKRFVKIGTDFITLLPPSYFKKEMTDEAIIKYFYEVADSVDTPCTIYNAPQFSGGLVLSEFVVKESSKHPNIYGLKDSSTGNIEKYLLVVKDDFCVMAGSANFFMNAMFMGAVGGVLSLANIFPGITVDLYKLITDKKYEKAIELNKKVIIMNKNVSGSGGVAAVKYAMDLVGLFGGNPRPPLLPLKEEVKNRIKRFLEEEKLI